MSPIPTVYSGACPQLATKIGDHLKYQETYLVAQRIKRLPTMRGDPGSIPGRKISWIRKWQPTPIFLPGKPHGQRILVGHSPWGPKESDTNERFHFLSLSSKRKMVHNSQPHLFLPVSCCKYTGRHRILSFLNILFCLYTYQKLSVRPCRTFKDRKAPFLPSKDYSKKEDT